MHQYCTDCCPLLSSPQAIMGVSQLKKFIKAHLKDNVLKNLLVRQMDIIDGSSLYNCLYLNSNLDQIHGGDYSGFQDEVCRFFKTLCECGVTPLVFLDGGSDADKITLEARMRNKIEKVIAKQKLDSSSPGKQDILPPLIKDVFIQILREINVEFEQCSGEADSRMVHWANMKHCPVLSNNADFYIFDVHGGFLPLDTFDWEHVSNGEIPAECYRIEAFCDYFNLDKALMPVFASLAGNDYSKLDDQGAFFTQYPPPDHLKSKDYFINRLHAILLFLGSLDLTDLNDSEKRERALSEAFRVVEFPKFLKSIQKYEPENPEETPSCLPGWLCDRLR